MSPESLASTPSGFLVPRSVIARQRTEASPRPREAIFEKLLSTPVNAARFWDVDQVERAKLPVSKWPGMCIYPK